MDVNGYERTERLSNLTSRSFVASSKGDWQAGSMSTEQPSEASETFPKPRYNSDSRPWLNRNSSNRLCTTGRDLVVTTVQVNYRSKQDSYWRNRWYRFFKQSKAVKSVSRYQKMTIHLLAHVPCCTHLEYLALPFSNGFCFLSSRRRPSAVRVAAACAIAFDSVFFVPSGAIGAKEESAGACET